MQDVETSRPLGDIMPLVIQLIKRRMEFAQQELARKAKNGK